MSTKIYNGYIFTKPMSLVDLQKFTVDFRTKLSDINRVLVQKDVASVAIRCYDNIASGLCTCADVAHLLSTNMLNGRKVTSGDGLYVSVINKTLNDHKIKSDFATSYKCSMVFLPISDEKTLMLFYGDLAEHLELLNSYDYIKEYMYFNNTDQPDEISAEEWEQREKDWGQALPGIGVPSESGLIVEYQNGISQYLYFETAQSIPSYFPDFASRCDRVANDMVYRTKFEALETEMLEKAENKESVKSYSALYYLSKQAKAYTDSEEGKVKVAEAFEGVKKILKQDLSLTDIQALKLDFEE